MANIDDDIEYFEEQIKRWTRRDNIDFHFIGDVDNLDYLFDPRSSIEDTVSLVLNMSNENMANGQERAEKYDVFYDAAPIGTVFSTNLKSSTRTGPGMLSRDDTQNYYYPNSGGRDIDMQEKDVSYLHIAVVPKSRPLEYYIAPILYPAKLSKYEFYLEDLNESKCGFHVRGTDSARVIIDRYFHMCYMKNGAISPLEGHEFSFVGKRNIDKLLAYLTQIDFPGQKAIITNFANHLEIVSNKHTLELELAAKLSTEAVNKI